MPTISPQGRLHVVKHQAARYLVNRSNLHVDWIKIADVSIGYFKSVGSFGGTPFYEIDHLYKIENVPPHSRVTLPDKRKERNTKLWYIEYIKWGLQESKISLNRDSAYLETEENSPNEDIEEEVVEREMHHIRTDYFDGKRIVKPWYKTPKKVDGEYVNHVFIFRWKRNLYLVNNADVGAERLRYRRKDERPNFPARVHEPKPPATFEIHDLPPGSYVHIMDDFDPNVESYSFNLKEANWMNGKTCRGSFQLGITTLLQPLHETDLAGVERTPTLVEEEDGSEKPEN